MIERASLEFRVVQIGQIGLYRGFSVVLGYFVEVCLGFREFNWVVGLPSCLGGVGHGGWLPEILAASYR